MANVGPHDAECVPSGLVRDPQQPPTGLIMDGSATRSSRFDQSFRFVIPKLSFTAIHLDDYRPVKSTFDEATRDGQILPIFYSPIHLNPMWVVTGLEKSAHRWWTYLRHVTSIAWRSHLAEAGCGNVVGPCPSVALDVDDHRNSAKRKPIGSFNPEGELVS